MGCVQSRFGALAFACILPIAVQAAKTVWNPESSVSAQSGKTHSQAESLRMVRAGATRAHAWEYCLQTAAQKSGVHPAVFYAIVKVESGRHPYAFGWYDSTGTWKSYRAPRYIDAVARFRELERQHIRFDVGLAQVNSRNLRILQHRIGLSPIQALDPCSNLHLAGLILREQINIHGRTWKAVAGYNGALTYAPKVYRAYCSQVPDALHCRTRVPLTHLLSYPLPVLQPNHARDRVDPVLVNPNRDESAAKLPSNPS